jgi:hypothetical protein
MLQLREDQISRLDRDASRAGRSRSQLVRDAVDALLSRAVDTDIAERYRTAYPDRRFGTDEWGDLDDWHEEASASRTESDRDAW